MPLYHHLALDFHQPSTGLKSLTPNLDTKIKILDHALKKPVLADPNTIIPRPPKFHLNLPKGNSNPIYQFIPLKSLVKVNSVPTF